MPNLRVVRAFHPGEVTPLEIKHDGTRLVSSLKDTESGFFRLELYENDTLALVLPTVSCKITHFDSRLKQLQLPYEAASDCFEVESDIRALVHPNQRSTVSINLTFVTDRRSAQPSLASVLLKIKHSFGDLGIELTHDKEGHNQLTTLGTIVDRLTSGVSLPYGSSKDSSWWEQLGGGGTNDCPSFTIDVRYVWVPLKMGKELIDRNAPRAATFPTLQFERKYEIQAPLSFPFGVQLQKGDSVRVHQRPSLQWLQNISADGQGGKWITFAGIPVKQAFEAWNRAIADPYLGAMKRSRAGAPASLMPHLQINPISPPSADAQWLIFLPVNDRSTEVEPKAGQIKALNAIFLPIGSMPAVVELPNLRAHTGTPLRLAGTVSASPTAETDIDKLESSHSRPYAGFGFVAASVLGTTVEDTTVRFGALDLQFGATKVSKNSVFEAWPRIDDAGLSSFYGIPERVGLSPNLPLIDAIPAGQDDLPASEYLPEGFSSQCPPNQDYAGCSAEEDTLEESFRREAPLILVKPREAGSPPEDGGSKTSLWLAAQETTRSDYSQTLRLSLMSHRETAQPPGAASLGAKGKKVKVAAQQPAKEDAKSRSEIMVVDRDPFMIALVRFTPIRDVKPNDSDEVAWWTNASIDGAAWHIVSDLKGSKIVLPPQTLGEAMLKRREIQDNERVNFRFSPPAEQTIEASYTPQHFAEVPWNLRRILGYAGQRDPGAGIVELQYELLYGLACSVHPTEMLRIAELFSTVGRIAGMLPRLIPVDVASRYQVFRKSWASLYGRYKSRLAVLEVRRPGPNYGRYLDVTAKAPEVLTLTDGVKCTLRKNADLYYPAWATADSLPKGCSQVDETVDDFNRCEGGLKGGVTWGFESPRLYRATVRNPNSDSAELSSPYFSTLGGWGFQKATFDNQRSTVYSHTSMGRLFSYSLERIGRIGNYGNLAKHVIQYERTVEPSDQFEDDQNFLHRRPVVRKVREYVEILEKEREVQLDTRNPAAGFIKKIVFKTTILNVLSEWGSNVGQTGWKVPIWRRVDSQRKPDVYPFPEIVLQVAGGTGAKANCGMLEPEKLFFYADTQAGGAADPHQWPLVPAVDFPPIPPCSPRTAFGSGKTNEELRTDPEYPPGFRLFTYALEPVGEGVNLVEGRADHTVAAVIRNVTVVRSAVTPALPPTIAPAQDIVSRIQSTYADLQSIYARGVATSEEVKAKIDKMCSENAVGIASVESALTSQAQQLSAQVRSQEAELRKAFALRVDGLLSGVNEEIAAQCAELWPVGQEVDVKQLQDFAKGEIQLLRSRLQTASASATALRNAVFQADSAVRQFEDDFRKKYQEAVDRLIGEAHEGSKGLSNFRSDFNRTIQEIQQQWSQLHAQVSANVSSWMPNSAALGDSALEPLETSFRYAIEFIEGQLASPNPAFDRIEQSLKSIRDVAFPSIPGLDTPVAGQAPAVTVRKLLEQDYPARAMDTIAATLQEKLLSFIADQTVDPIDKAKLLALGRDKLLKAIREELVLNKVVPGGTFAVLSAASDSINLQIDQAVGVLNTAASGASSPLNEIKKLGCTNFNDWTNRDKVTDLLRGLEAGANRLFESVAENLKDQIKIVEQAADSPMQLLRAFGQPPSLPNLNFSLPNLGYYFRPNVGKIDLTPVLTQVNRLGPALQDIGNAINPLGTQFPSISLLDHVVPPDLSKFDLSSIFPDFGGLKLDNLFPNLQMPVGSSDKVRLTHGADPSAKTAWVTADIDFTTDSSATLFSFGPMTLTLPSARFRARVEMKASARGLERKSAGSISGDWQLQFGGTTFVTLRDTSLTFDEGGLHFNVSPDKVQLAGVLNFVSEMLATVSDPDSGFVAAPTPTGFEARLDLPVPDIQLGTFGISNLRLRNSLALDVAGAFTIKTGFALASRQAPFNLTVFILGGGGFLEASAIYTPSTGTLQCEAHIGITAGASLAIALGPIRGGVYVYVGITVDFSAGGAQPKGLAIGAMLLIRGQVSILSIVSAYIAIGLDLTYGSGELVGRGYFSISIKICWCFTLSVSQAISFRVGSASGRSSIANPDPVYLATMFPNDGTVSDVPTLFLPSDENHAGGDKDPYYSAANEYISMFAEDAA